MQQAKQVHVPIINFLLTESDSLQTKIESTVLVPQVKEILMRVESRLFLRWGLMWRRLRTRMFDSMFGYLPLSTTNEY
jgi:hypothetical protein